MADPVSIINEALTLLAEAPITDPDEDTVPARVAKRVYDQVRRDLLMAYPWRFAGARAPLPETTAPAFGYGRAFTLPADCLAVRGLGDERVTESEDIDYVVEGRQLLTDAAAPLKLRYTRDVTDPGVMTPGFVRAFAAALAVAIAPALPGNRAWWVDLTSLAAQRLEAAKVDEARQLPPRRLASGSALTRVRR